MCLLLCEQSVKTSWLNYRARTRSLRSRELLARYGFTLELSDAMASTLIQDPMGDALDALLCSVQAAWVYTQRDNGYGIPAKCNRDEGWIVDPQMKQLH